MSTNNPFKPGDLVVFREIDELEYAKHQTEKNGMRQLVRESLRSLRVNNGVGPFEVVSPKGYMWCVGYMVGGEFHKAHWSYFKAYTPSAPAGPKTRRLKLRTRGVK